MKQDFYISHASADAQWAEWIAGTLEENGYNVFLWSWDIKAGDNWLDKTGCALENCERFICVLSPRFLNSKFATDELNEASKSGKRIIPIRVEDFHVSGLLETIVYVDFVGKNEEDATKTLLNAVSENRYHRKKPIYPSSKASLIETEFPKVLFINNLPPRNNYFSGHNEQLERIANVFKTSSQVSIAQAVSGYGGIGKTQLAIEYAYRYASNYQTAVWFINAENSTTIYKGFLEFASTLQIELPDNINEDDLCSAIKYWMRENKNWLIIFDNFKLKNNLTKYLPEGHIGGHVLFTTRNALVLTAPSIELSIFTLDEAIEFIKTRVGNDNFNSVEAHLLAERLGYLPLALEQAVAYILITKVSISQYLELISEQSLDIFDNNCSKTECYANSVSTAFQSSFELLSEAARQLLNMCAYMAPDKIPINFFVEMRDKFPMPLKVDLSEELTQNRILAELRNCSLISGNTDFVSIHPLTQEIIRQSHNIDTQWLNYCFDAIEISLPHDFSTSKARMWFTCLVSHSETVLQYMNYRYAEDDATQESMADLYNWIGFGFNDTAYYPQALGAYNKARSIREKVFGIEHPSIATIYNNIALVYSNQGDYAAALEWYYKALFIREKVLGKEHPDTAITYNNIAEVYNNQGNFQKALAWYERALIIYEKVLGKSHPSTAIIYNNISEVYISQGDCQKALEWSYKAIDIREKVLGKEHPDVAATYNNIALVNFCQGDYAVALEWYYKALVIYEKVLGKEHPDTAKIYSNIAAVYYNTGECTKALAYYANALRIYFNILGESHPSVQVIFEKARKTFTSINRPESFEQWLQEAFVHGGNLQ